MNQGEAMAIFEQLDSDKYSDLEKIEAVKIVTNMATLNSRSREQLTKGLRFMVKEYGARERAEIMVEIPQHRIEELAKDITQTALDTKYKGKTIREWIDIVILAALNTQEPKAPYFYDAKTGSYIPINISRSEKAEKPERLTVKEWSNLDPWETCGDLTETCNRGTCCGCIVPKLYAKLAKFEDEQEGAKE